MPDEHTRISTFCRVCEPSCGLVAEVAGGEVVRLSADREHPVTKGFACHKGLASLDIHRDPDRLDHPLRRGSGGFERVTWDDAAGEIAGRVREILDTHGPDALAVYLGNPLAFNSLSGPAIGSFIGQVGTRRIFGSGTQDCANKFAAGEAVFGSSTIHPIPDIEHTDHLLVLGSNPRVSHMSFMSIVDPVRVIREAVARGATVRYVNPRRIESLDSTGGEMVLVRPDSDVYLMAALLSEMDRLGLFSEEVVSEHGKHVEELRSFVRRYPAERVASITGVDAARIRKMAEEFARASSAAVYMSTGVNMGRQGTLAYWLLFMLSFVTGNLDRRGGNLYSLGFYPAAKAGRTNPERAFFDSAHGRIRHIRGSLPGNLLADMIEEERDPIRALFVVAGNPILSLGGESRLRKAFEKLELLVTVDIYRNATGELAHFALPSTDMLERPDINLCGLGMQHRPFVQLTDRVVAPRAERREEWWIFARLEQELGFKSALDAGREPPLFTRLDHMLARSGLSVEALREAPHGTAVLPEPEPGRFFEEWIQTPDRRIDCCPPLFSHALARAEDIFIRLEAEPEGQLKLITKRDLTMHNSWYQNLPKLKGRRHRVNGLHMHPDDAQSRGLAQGDRVGVASADGRVEAQVALDQTLMQGVVALTHGWGNARTPGMRVANRHPGVNVNELLPTGPGSFEPLSNQAFMTGIAVEVEPLTSDARLP